MEGLLMCSRIENETGQASVEAALLLPVLLILLGLIAQPTVLFYNRCVMTAAAAEGCRMLATRTMDDASARAYVVRKLAAVPKADLFHCGGDAGWEIEFAGGAGETASVRIRNRAKLLPLLGISAGLMGSIQGDGTVEQEVSASGDTWPGWAAGAVSDPASLAAEWE